MRRCHLRTVTVRRRRTGRLWPAGLISLGLNLGATPSQAAESVEFEQRFLRQTPGVAAIDVRRFSNGNPTPPGRYHADVTLNGKPKGRQEIVYVDTEGERGIKGVLCLSPELLTRLDLRPEAIALPPSETDCTPLNESVPSARARFDLSTLRLHLEVPQALVMTRPRGYVSPSEWQDGVPAAFLHYDANHYRYRTLRHHSQQSYLGLRGGVNLGGWTLRHRGALQWHSQGERRYQRIDTYIERELPALRGQLTLGDFHTGGRLLEGLSLRGLRLASDERMLPGSLQGYAPVVRGIADSTSNLAIRQNGNLIYETTVPAGPFVIDDLYPSGYGGDLEVTLTEADGRVRVFTVPFASVAELIRPGYARYQLAGGRYREAGRQFDEWVAQGSVQYGLVNDLTLNAAFTAATHYRAGLLGAAVNTRIGAFSADITIARAQLRHEHRNPTGHSLHLSYSTRVPRTDTYFTLAAYRYSSRDFYTLRDTLWRNRDQRLDTPYLQWAGGTGFRDWPRRPRHRLQLSVNQRLPNGWGSLYLSGSTEDDWNHRGRRNEYQAGYNQQYRLLSYQVGYSQSRDPYAGRRDHRIYLSLSIPLGQHIGRPLLSGSISRHAGDGYRVQSSVSGVAGTRKQFGYGLSASTQQHGAASYGLNGSWQGPFARLNASTSLGSDGNRQFSAGASGAIVAHPKGITFSNDLSDNFVIIHAPGAGGAEIRNAAGNRVDAWGNGIVPFVSPYQRNQVGLDPSDLPLDVSLSATEQEIVPRANSATLVSFATETGTAMLFDIELADGTLPPMTADVFDEKGQFVGFVAQAGRFFARGLPASGTLTVAWGSGKEAQRCRFPYDTKTASRQHERAPAIQTVRCLQEPT